MKKVYDVSSGVAYTNDVRVLNGPTNFVCDTEAGEGCETLEVEEGDVVASYCLCGMHDRFRLTLEKVYPAEVEVIYDFDIYLSAEGKYECLEAYIAATRERVGEELLTFLKDTPFQRRLDEQFREIQGWIDRDVCRFRKAQAV